MFIGCSKEEAALAAEELGLDLPAGSNVMSLEQNQTCPPGYQDYGVENMRRHCVDIMSVKPAALPAIRPSVPIWQSHQPPPGYPHPWNIPRPVGLPAPSYGPFVFPTPLTPRTLPRGLLPPGDIRWVRRPAPCPSGFREEIQTGRGGLNRKCVRRKRPLAPFRLRQILTRYMNDEMLNPNEQETVDDLERRGILEQRLQSFGLLSGDGIGDRPLLVDWVTAPELEETLRKATYLREKAQPIDQQYVKVGLGLLKAIKEGKFRQYDAENLVYSFGKAIKEWREFATTDQYLTNDDLSRWLNRALGWKESLASKGVSSSGDWRTRKRADEGKYMPVMKPTPQQVFIALQKHMQGGSMSPVESYAIQTLKTRGLLGRAMAKFGLISSTMGNAADAEAIMKKMVKPWAFTIYQRELRRSPGSRGKVAVAFTTDPFGKVTSVRIAEDTLGVPAVARAIVQIVRSQKFPATQAPAEHLYPFIFQPA